MTLQPSPYFGGSTAPVAKPVKVLKSMAAPWYAPGAVDGSRDVCQGWQYFRVRFDRLLSFEECWHAAGAIGYALKEVMRQEKGVHLSSPVIRLVAGPALPGPDGERLPVTEIYFAYDSTASPDTSSLCHRTDRLRAAVEAFRAATEYVQHGSPVRGIVGNDEPKMHTAGEFQRRDSPCFVLSRSFLITPALRCFGFRSKHRRSGTRDICF